MDNDRPPHKPSHPLGVVMFPKRGRPYRVIEELPSAKDALEAAIVTKFVGALQQGTGRKFSPAVKGDEPADFETTEAGRSIGIQIAGVANDDVYRLRRTRDQYSAYVSELLRDVWPRLSGLLIELVDDYHRPPYGRHTRV